MEQDKNIQRFKEEFATFEEASRKYEQQHITADEYSSVSKGFGEYLQRDNQQMLRIRIPGGRMTMKMLKAILDSCRYYQVNTLKITAGQALQLHDLNPHAGRRLILRLLDAGIVTRGSGGDNPNNISASPLSGVEVGEHFDVQPYAQAVDRYLLRYTGITPLPRKFKIAFSNTEANVTHATFKDLGFTANADHTFDVYAAGGLGINPMVGIKVADHIPPSQIRYHLRTMLDVYIENGNYENRHKARSRFLQETMGVDGFVEAYQAHLQEVLEEQSLSLELAEIPVHKKGMTDAEIGLAKENKTGSEYAVKHCELLAKPHELQDNPRVTAQKQPGLYAVSYHPIGGYITLDMLGRIYDLIAGWQEVEVRLTNDGGLYVINLNAEEAANVLALTDRDGAYDDFSASIACVGHRRCDIGVADSQKLLRDCIAAVEKEHFSPGTLPQMRISGCISSCGAQQVGTIGWRGVKRRTEEGPVDAYFFNYGGCETQGQEKLSFSSRVMLASDIPAFLVELGRTVEKTGLHFTQWMTEHEEQLCEIADRYVH